MNTNTFQSNQTATSVSVRGVSIVFGNHKVINDLSLDVETSEILALVGASGCGKSTLLRAIAKLQTISSGEITYSDDARRSSDLAFVFQDPTLLPWRTVIENVRLPLELGSRGRIGEEACVDALTAVGLSTSDHLKFPRELSGGMRMRVSIARALVTDPSIMLLDEPFAALDEILRTRLNELLLELWTKRKRTIVFVTHNIAEAIYLSHRIAVFGKGRIVKVLNNNLGWPRSEEQRSSVAFGEFYGAVSHTLMEAQS